MSAIFQVQAQNPAGRARTGRLLTSHGEVETPVFMPVGTAGSVKAMPQEWVEEVGASIILANTYHLYLRPGAERIRELGGLHRFMSWDRAILTDSGGYQVFSHRELRQMNENGVEFKSHLDGSLHFLSPEKSIEIQRALGSDIVMAFDECTPYPVSHADAEESMELSMRWARRCRQVGLQEHQKMFGIVQGSVFPDLRRQSLEQVLEMGFDGVALGGFSVGEPNLLMYEQIAELAPLLPAEQPHYLMGVGTPLDLLEAVSQGLDMFDCVLPTRNARNGTLFTSAGKLRIKNACFRDDPGPLDAHCGCRVCRRYSRAYLRHLFVSGEILASILNTYHNLYFYLDLMRRIRESIGLGLFEDFKKTFESRYTDTV